MESNNSLIITIVIVLIIAAVVIIYFKKSKNKYAKNGIAKQQEVKPSNLKELSDKFKDDYFKFELSQFAKIERIDFEKVKEIYPKLKHTNNPASIDWTTFTGRHKELEDFLTSKNWDKYQNFTILDRYIYFLKESYENELNYIKAKIKELK